jgi:two-component system response regulator
MALPILLLLEDNPDDVELLRVALSENKVLCELVVVEEGRDLLDFVFREGIHSGREAQRQPRLVLLDLKTPGIAGDEVLRQLRSDPRSCLIPVVILSSSDDPSDVEQAYAEGANAYLQKPVALSCFMTLVGSLVRFWFSTHLLLAKQR